MRSRQSSTACAMSRLFSVRMIVKEICSGQHENIFENKIGNGKCESFSRENCKSILQAAEEIILNVFCRRSCTQN